MTRKSKILTILQLAIILAIAFALKYFYSTASVGDLRWILGPTAFLVETITDIGFTFESHAGYMSDDHTFLIAASCSGVNFLLISFLMLALGKIWREWPRNLEWGFLPVAALVAYSTTLIANTVRIVAALGSQNLETRLLDRDELHRVEGIVVYFGFLLVLLLVSEKLATRGAGGRIDMSAIAFRSKYLLLIYYGVTLGIPLARGSYQ